MPINYKKLTEESTITLGQIDSYYKRNRKTELFSLAQLEKENTKDLL